MSTHNIPFSIQKNKKKITLNFPNLQPRDYFLGTQERVRNIRGKRDISVRAIEVLLYFVPSNNFVSILTDSYKWSLEQILYSKKLLYLIKKIK